MIGSDQVGSTDRESAETASVGRTLELAVPLAAIVLVWSYAVGFRLLGRTVGFLDGVRWTDAYWWFAGGSFLLAVPVARWLLGTGVHPTRALWRGVAAMTAVVLAAVAVAVPTGVWNEPAVEMTTLVLAGALALWVGFRGQAGDLGTALRAAW